MSDGGGTSSGDAEQYEGPDDSVCTEFRFDEDLHAIDGEVVETWSFECTRCGHYTPCVDAPETYGGRPYSCTNCGWVSLIDQDAIEEFADEQWNTDTDTEASDDE